MNPFSFSFFSIKEVILLMPLNVSGTLDPNTQLLLTSALYFKGRWLKSFDRGATRVRCFHVPQHGCRNVPMMENTSKYRYAYVTPLDADVVELPYSVKFHSCLTNKLIKKIR